MVEQDVARQTVMTVNAKPMEILGMKAI